MALAAPVGVSAATNTGNSGTTYDITSDSLFTGIANSGDGGAGNYTVRFFTPGPTVNALAQAGLTDAAISASFTDLKMIWVDGATLNELVSASGVDTLSTVFDMTFPNQQLRFEWTNSDAGQGFRYDVITDVQTGVGVIPLPASVLLLGSALAGLGVFRRRQTAAKGGAV